MSNELNTVKIDPIDVLICQVMKITKVKDKIIACPAIMLAKRRIISAKGFVKMPKTSINGITGGIFSHSGTLGHRISFQYSLFPKRFTANMVPTASNNVMLMLPVTLAPPGKIGMSPSRLFVKMKKNTVNKKGA